MKSCFEQQRVSAAHVMVVGCGALGNEVLKNLVLLGVEHIVVVDFDIVEMGNLSRSVLFSRADADAHRLKVDVVAERLKTMNPAVEVKTICGDIAYDVGLGVIRRMDVVIGCVDSRWARYCINRLCMRAGIPWVDGGIGELEGTARVFVPGRNCYACNLGPEGLMELARRMPCSGIIRRHEEVGLAPTTSIVASVVGAVQVQEALKLINHEVVEQGDMTSLCGKMFYYDGQHLTTKLVDFLAYDEDCTVHEQWQPVRQSGLTTEMSVAEAMTMICRILVVQQVCICLENDCFVDYVVERSNDRQTRVMCPGRAVERFVEQDAMLRGIPNSGLYQHEYREVDYSFPYQEQTLSQLGIPANDVLHLVADGQDYYMEMDVS
ncbi:MAG: HesA/MoeB/ThiF family protein [Prevotella sp.]|nr:HesA/MoeB/ThiF family protein [Prevotella sp.]MBR0165519.1 HesA/MoeB/ThiF family protein [Prevotella sp.]